MPLLPTGRLGDTADPRVKLARLLQSTLMMTTQGRVEAMLQSAQLHGCHQEPCRSLATSNGDVQTIDETMDGVLALLQSTPSSLLQNVPMRKLTVDLDVKLSRDRQANRATKTNMCMRLREYYSEEYTSLPVSI